MAVTLKLRTEDDNVTAYLNGEALAGPTPLADLPALKTLQADPYNRGQALFRALGGDALLAHLRKDADRLLLLAISPDDPADGVAWEFAAISSRQLLAVAYGLLRLIEPARPVAAPAGAGQALQFVALTADPLVDEEGRPREGYRLNVEHELRAIRRVLAESAKVVQARRLPPTHDALMEALQVGPAILHLSCHGDVVDTDAGTEAILWLEDLYGGSDPLWGSDLVDLPPDGVLRLVVLSACQTASHDEARLARALVLNGVPAAIGMQGNFLDSLSDDFAVALYRALLNNSSPGEALRQARYALRRHVDMVGLPVGYVTCEGLAPVALVDGLATVDQLSIPGRIDLPEEVQPPRPLLGRNRELYELARLYPADGKTVVTVAGPGGMGKTALAAAFAERFAWRWPQGVAGVTFASGEPDLATFQAELLRRLFPDPGRLLDLPLQRQAEQILRALPDWEGLLLLDNYETILQALARAPAAPADGATATAATGAITASELLDRLLASYNEPELRELCLRLRDRYPEVAQLNYEDLPGSGRRDKARELVAYVERHGQLAGLVDLVRQERPPSGTARPKQPGREAAAIHQLVGRIAEGGVNLLLTSREQPAGLRGETLFPSARRPLTGIQPGPAAALFFDHSSKARENRPAYESLAREVGRVTEGHPLAIALLAGEFDVSDVATAHFLDNWAGELAAARRDSLAGHHVTFTVAFNRSYERLPEQLQMRLRALTIFPFPFYAEGAALAWGLAASEDGVAAARADLGRLARANLLEVDGWFEDDTPAAYRFQPALYQEVARRLTDVELAELAAAYAAYGAWLARFGYIQMHSEPALARRVRLSMDAMDAAMATLDGNERLWHIRRLAWIKNAFGQTKEAYDLLAAVLPADAPLPDAGADEEAARIGSSLRFELANLCVTRGELERALKLYEESLQLLEQIGDIQGKAASLSMMAQVFVTRGELERALKLYEESLQLKEQIGDIQGKAAYLHNMANILMARNEWDEAKTALEEARALAQKVGSVEHVAFATVKLGQVAQARDNRETALVCFQEGLAIFEHLGMPEANQVRQMIVALEAGGEAPADPLGYLIAQARLAAQQGNHDAAIQAQEEAVDLLRQSDKEEAITTLAIQLYNLAGYYGNANRHDDAVHTLEEVVDLARRINHLELAELAPQALTEARHVAALSPEERAARQQVQQAQAHLQELVQRARDAAERGDIAAAVVRQEEAVTLARQFGDSQAALVQLSVLLYNLAGYYQQAERLEAAVTAFEEVVTLDERTAHPDLEQDRLALEQARRLAALSPEERVAAQNAARDSESPGESLAGMLSVTEAHLAQLSPEERAQAEAALSRFAALTPEQQAKQLAALQAGAQRHQIETLTDQTRDAAIAALRGEADPENMAGQMDQVATQAEEGEESGSPWYEVGQFVRAVAALLRGQPALPVPSAYAGHMAAVQEAAGEEGD